MKTTVFLAAVATIAVAHLAVAQAPPGIDMAAVNTTLPEDGAPKAIAGPYDVTAESAPGIAVYRPTDLGRFPKQDTLPVLAWGNGGCAVDGARYAGFLKTIASHGFLVMTTAPQEGAPRRQATADDLKAAIDWAGGENAREGSPLNGKIDMKKVAVMGQSCGGALSITLGADPRVGTIGVFNSGLQAGAPPPNAAFPAIEALKSLHGPVLFINGAERDFMTARSKSTYDAIETLPAFYGARHGAGHTATVFHAGGGEYANVASNWLLWQFKGDRKASRMFVGAKCALCTDSNWDAESKRLK